MKVRLLVSRAGPMFSQKKGDVVEVSPDEAKRLFASGNAEAIKGGSAKGAAPTSKPQKKAKK